MRKIIEKFEKGCEAELKAKTKSQYKYLVKEYLDWLDHNPEEVDNPELTVEEFLRHRANEKVKDKRWSDKTCELALYSLSRLYNKTLKIDFDPSKVVLYGEPTEHKPVILSRDEVELIQKEAPKFLSHQEEVMLKVGWECALRSGELVRLKGMNLLGDNWLKCPVLKTQKGKKRYKRIKILANLYDTLETEFYKGDSICLFHNPEYGKRYSAMTWSGIFSKFVEQLDLKQKPRYHDYSRNTRLTLCAEETKSLYDVLQLSGHASVNVCRQYFEQAEVSTEEFEHLER